MAIIDRIVMMNAVVLAAVRRNNVRDKFGFHSAECESHGRFALKHGLDTMDLGSRDATLFLKALESESCGLSRGNSRLYVSAF